MIDPTEAKLAAMAYRCNAYGTWPSAELSELIEIVSTLNQRVIGLERRTMARLTEHFKAIDQLQQKVITDLKEELKL